MMKTQKQRKERILKIVSSRATAFLLLLIFAPSAGLATDVVTPGEEFLFCEADTGNEGSNETGLGVATTLLAIGNNEARVEARAIGATASAFAEVGKEFVLESQSPILPGMITISPSSDPPFGFFNGFIKGSSLIATAEVKVRFIVRDLTDGTVIEETILDEKENGEAFTTITNFLNNPFDGPITIEAELRNGHTYEAVLRVDVSAELGAAEADFFTASESRRIRFDCISVFVEPGCEEEIEKLRINLEESFTELQAEIDANEAKIDSLDAALNDESRFTDDAELAAHQETVVAEIDINEAKIDVLDEKLDETAVALESLRIITCDLNRLLHTPFGLRSSDVMACSDQPGFPYTTPGNGGKGNSLSEGMPDSSAESTQIGGLPALQSLGTMVLETHLLQGRLVPTLYLPGEKGGMISQVRSLVWNTIEAHFELGISVRTAENAWDLADEADRFLDQMDFLEAYRRYSLAYRALASPQPGQQEPTVPVPDR